MRERDIFIEALQKADPADRGACLDAACAGDEVLRQRVLQLLAEHEKQESFLLDAPPHLLANHIGETIDQPTNEAVGTLIGPYKLLEQIGEGGMGTVWMAQQTEPVKRVVALKLIKAGMDSKQVIARFEAERQALALMDHVNIARVLDAGTTNAGRPYFVMDLVKGVPITRYCDEHQLTPRQRLEMFIPVCQAVQHAHQKGIIHRDLKPSNVLVALYDGKPAPKVIDFGVAKAAGQPLTEKTLVTGFGAIVGTLEYMSPEQAEINQLDIDTRSDIYSLGVLLYELLAGSPPFTKHELENVGMLEMLRVIREQEPSKPSTKLSSSDALPTLSANRGTDPAKLTKLVRGELDWIVMKALEKDRTRRYETANGFAMDVHRYLADEPVQACPPSMRYRLRKFIKRHKGPVLAGSLLIFALLTGVVGTTLGFVRALAESKDKEKAREEAVNSAKAERDANQLAQKRLVHFARVNEILGSVFDDLDPNSDEFDALPLRAQLGERLDKAASLLDEVAGDPLAVAHLQGKLAVSLIGLGYAKKAIPLLVKARATFEKHQGADHANTLGIANNLGLAYQAAGQFAKSRLHFEQTLATRMAKLGGNHEDTLASMNNLAADYRLTEENDKALVLLEGVLAKRRQELGPNNPRTLTSMHNVAAMYRTIGQHKKAITLFEETLALRIKLHGPEHRLTLVTANGLAGAHNAAGERAKAIALYEKTLAKQQETLAPDHPDCLTTMHNLALAYRDDKQTEKGISLLEQTVAKRTKKLGDDHPNTLMSMHHLALEYSRANEPAKALPILLHTVAKRRERLSAEHPDTMGSLNNLGALYMKLKQPKLAVPHFEEAFRLRKSRLGADSSDTILSMSNLAIAYRDVGRLKDGIILLEEAVQTARKAAVPSAALTGYTVALAKMYTEAGQHDKAEGHYRYELSKIKREPLSYTPQSLMFLGELGLSLIRQKKHAEAEPLLQENLEIVTKHAPKSWQRFDALCRIGANRLNQKNYAEAERLLLEGYEGMKQLQAKIPEPARFRMTEALDWIVQLYEAMDNAKEAARWRAMREKK